MNSLNRNLFRALFRVVGLGWLGFLGMGLLIAQVFSIPQVTLIVDRSYCAQPVCQMVAQQYAELYQRQQQRQVVVTQAIVVSDLGEEVWDDLPEPAVFEQLNTYGQPNQARITDLQAQYPEPMVLSCQAF